MQTRAEQKIKQARAWLVREHIWLGALSLRLEPTECNDPRVTFMGTDGARLFYNTQRIEAENIENIAGVISHEVAHCMLGHFARRGDRDEEDWNIATDYAANQLLEDAGIKLPETALIDPKYVGWTSERIYIDVHNRPKTPKEKEGSKDGLVMDGGQEDGEGQESKSENAMEKLQKAKAVAELEKEWDKAGEEAKHVATAKGEMPGKLADALARAKEPKQDWRALLRQFAVDPTTGDYRFSPPNRRHIWRGAYLPGVRAHQVGTMVQVIDTSGSTLRDIETFKAEGVSMLESGIIGELVVIACDARAHLVGRFSRGQEIEWPERLPGGGGTDFAPAFRLVESLGIAPTCLAYLTDLMGGFPKQEPAYPVLWITTRPGCAPFGTVTEME